MGRKRSTVFPGRFELISQICDFVGRGATEAGFGTDDRFQLTLACDEACTNIIEHAYGDEEGEIFVSWEIGEDGFVITLRDQGTPFDPADVSEPAIPATPSALEEMQVGGLGLFIMRKVMDRVRFQFDETGNMVVMTKLLPAPPQFEDDR